MTTETLKSLFDDFIKHHKEEEKNNIWHKQSTEFREFWTDKIMAADTKELYDQDIDDIVRILDRNGKGNTKESDAIARVMIPQGAWRRLFNQLKEENELSITIDSIFKAKSEEELAGKINELYTLNEGNKNNLTGKSGNAINCLMAAYDPFKNLSIVSLNDRNNLLKFLEDGYNTSADSIGNEIVSTSKHIINIFKEAGIFNNSRTISEFVYSGVFKSYWKGSKMNEEGNSFVEDEISEEPKTVIQDDFIFYMEKQLEDFLIENWDKTELGSKYELINNDDGLASQQYRTDIGTIDILAKDKTDGRYVIIELKKNQTSDDTIGQIARYMGWVEEHLSEGQESKGIIIAGKYDKKLKYAMKKIKDIEVYLYKVDFRLNEFFG